LQHVTDYSPDWYVLGKYPHEKQLCSTKKKEIMKKLMLAVCLMFGSATFVAAQEQTPPSQTPTAQDQDQDRQQISVSELPEGVTAKLESQDYSGWTVGNAYKKMDDSQNEVYIVEMRQGTETKKVKFDKDGNLIEKHDKDKDKADDTNYRDDSDATQSETETEQTDNTDLEKDPQ
jgi:hypothetical protein